MPSDDSRICYSSHYLQRKSHKLNIWIHVCMNNGNRLSTMKKQSQKQTSASVIFVLLWDCWRFITSVWCCSHEFWCTAMLEPLIKWVPQPNWLSLTKKLISGCATSMSKYKVDFILLFRMIQQKLKMMMVIKREADSVLASYLIRQHFPHSINNNRYSCVCCSPCQKIALYSWERARMVRTGTVTQQRPSNPQTIGKASF